MPPTDHFILARPVPAKTGSESTLESFVLRWEELTARESSAIEAEAWDALAEAQRCKADIQALWTQRGLPVTSKLQDAAARLIEKERLNLKELDGRLDELRRRIAALDQSGRDLRRVHRSYAASGSSTAAFSSRA
jgi:hypothetical protein